MGKMNHTVKCIHTKNIHQTQDSSERQQHKIQDRHT